MKRMFWVGISIFALMLCGCGEKLMDAQKSSLSLAALSAKERASAFEVIKDKLVPVNDSDALPLKNFVAAHAKGLNAQAAGMAELVKAIQAGSLLAEQTRQMLNEEAKTAAARARNFDLARTSIRTADLAIADFVQSHAAALKSQTEALQQAATLFPLKPATK